MIVGAYSVPFVTFELNFECGDECKITPRSEGSAVLLLFHHTQFLRTHHEDRLIFVAQLCRHIS